jgi:uncharacterized metal-binding protein YceD (DUF177 family)
MLMINLNRVGNVPLTIEEDIEFLKEELPNHPSIISIPHGDVIIDLTYGEDHLYRVDIDGEFTLRLHCDYTYEPFDKVINFFETIYFSLDNDIDDEEKDIFYLKNPVFDILPYITGLIVLNLPQKIVHPNYKEILKKQETKHISEDEYLSEIASKNRPFADLEDIIE